MIILALLFGLSLTLHGLYVCTHIRVLLGLISTYYVHHYYLFWRYEVFDVKLHPRPRLFRNPRRDILLIDCHLCEFAVSKDPPQTRSRNLTVRGTGYRWYRHGQLELVEELCDAALVESTHEGRERFPPAESVHSGKRADLILLTKGQSTVGFVFNVDRDEVELATRSRHAFGC